MRRQFGAIALFIALTLAGGSVASPTAAATEFSKDEAAIAEKLEGAYGVKVLHIRSGEINGTPIYIVTVMNPAGDYNTAFQVTTLAVDKTSGALVPQYRQTPTGQRHAGAESREPPTDASGAVIRQWTERRLRQR